MSAPEWSGRLEDSVPVGARVKLTGVFLKNTGQVVGGEGAKVWTVISQPNPRLVLVDEYPIEVELEAAAQLRAQRQSMRVAAALAAAERNLANYTEAEKAAPREHPRAILVANLMPEHPRTPRARYYP